MPYNPITTEKKTTTGYQPITVVKPSYSSMFNSDITPIKTGMGGATTQAFADETTPDTVNTLKNLFVNPTKIRPAFGKVGQEQEIGGGKLVGLTTDIASRLLEVIPKSVTQAIANFSSLVGREVTSPIDATRLGIETTKTGAVKTTGQKYVEEMDKIGWVDHPEIKNLSGALFGTAKTALADMMDAWMAGDMLKAIPQTALFLTKFSPELDVALARQGLNKGNFSTDTWVNNIQNSIRSNSEIGNMVGIQQTINDAAIIQKHLSGKGVPILNEFTRKIQDYSKTLLGIETPKSFGQVGKAEVLPGTAIEGIPQPAFGMSIQPVKKVGIPEGLPKIPIQTKPLAQEAGVGVKPVDNGFGAGQPSDILGSKSAKTQQKGFDAYFNANYPKSEPKVQPLAQEAGIKTGTPVYRGQDKPGDVFFNKTNFLGDAEGGVFFTPEINEAKRFGKNIIERTQTKQNTVSIKESDELQKMATREVEKDLKNMVESDELIEQMALGRPKAFAEFTKKPFVETGDKFGIKGELIYYKELDKTSPVKPLAQEANKIQPILKEKYPNLDFFVSERGGEITLSKIIIPNSERGKGIGTKFMEDLIKYSDETGQRILLTPTKDFGGTVSRLNDFYKRFGFVSNKGKSIDFSTKETMIRIPKSDVSFSKKIRSLEIPKEKAREIADRITKGKSSVYFTKELIEGSATGSYTDSISSELRPVIRMFENKGMVDALVPYHEAFHYLMAHKFTPEEISVLKKQAIDARGPIAEWKVLDNYKDKYLDLSPKVREDKILEEYMANKYAKVQSGIELGTKDHWLKTFFVKLDQILKGIKDSYNKIKNEYKNFMRKMGGSQKGSIDFSAELPKKKVSEVDDLEKIFTDELKMSEADMEVAITEYNAVRGVIAKRVSKTPMIDYVKTIKPEEIALLKPTQQEILLKYADVEKAREIENIIQSKQVREDIAIGPADQAVQDLLKGKRQIDLSPRRTEFKESLGDYLYNKINKKGAEPFDSFVKGKGISMDDFIETMWREVNNKAKIKPTQMEARTKFIEARSAQIKRRFTLEQVAKKIEKERAIKTKTIEKVIVAKRKAEQELQDFIKIGKTRGEKLNAIQDYFALSDSKMDKIQGRRDIRILNDEAFNQFLYEVSNKAQLEAELSEAKMQVKSTIFEKELSGVENLQKAIKFPIIDKMSITELKEFDKILSQYQMGDIFLSQRKLETIDNTNWKGIKTLREAKQKVSEKIGVKPEDLNINVSEFDRMRFDTALAESNPFYRYFVEGFQASILEGGARFEEVQQMTNKLVNASRKGKGIKLVQQDKKIVKYLEAIDKETVIKKMTPEEITAAEYIKTELEKAYQYELETQMLKKSSYEGIYMPHIQRTFLEAVKDSGWKTAFTEMFKKHAIDEKVMTILDQKTGSILPYEKFFRFALRRSGEVIPTQNIARSFLTYMRQFERKRALDRIIPEIMTAVDVVSPREMTPRGLVTDDTLKTFVSEYLNTKKGRPVKMFVKPGGKIDFVLKSVKTFTNLTDLAINIPLQLGSRGGTEVSSYVGLGIKKYTLGKVRLFTKKGKNFVAKYENFTERTPWDVLKDASIDLPEKIYGLMFSLFRDATVKANKIHLLGNLTKTEYDFGIISTDRLAGLKTDMGRWLPVEGSKSILGSTTEGGLFTQYRTWAIPIIRTGINDLTKLTKMVATGKWKTASNSREFWELFRIAQTTIVVVLVGYAIGYNNDKKANGFIKNLINKTLRDAFSMIGSFDPATWQNGIRTMSFFTSLMKAMSDLVRLTEYKTSGAGYKKGDLMGVNELQNLFTPSIMKQMFPKKTPKKTGGLMF